MHVLDICYDVQISFVIVICDVMMGYTMLCIQFPCQNKMPSKAHFVVSLYLYLKQSSLIENDTFSPPIVFPSTKFYFID